MTHSNPLAVLEKYASKGEHRSGTEPDLNTSRWLAQELRSLGYSSQLRSWPLQVFDIGETRLEVAGQSFSVFPFWYPQPTSTQGIVAPLKLWDGKTDQDLKGAIALVALDSGRLEVHYDPAPMAIHAAKLGAEGLVEIIKHPIKAVSAQNANAPWHQQALPLPSLIAAEMDSEVLLQLAREQTSARMVLSGTSRKAEAFNTLGSLDRDAKHWLVVSTPISGWFEVTNERGPGIAMWLDLARTLIKENTDYNLLFVGLSGHELNKMGMHALVESKILPSTENVFLWLHLGSGIAVNEPLLSAVSYSSSLTSTVKTSFASLPGIMHFPEAKMPRGSEQYTAMELGYPVVGLFGADKNIHTKQDLMRMALS